MGPGELEPLRELVQQAAHVRAQFDAGTERLYMLATWPELGAVLALFWPAKLLPQALRSSGREWGVALLATSPALWGCIYLLREIQWCSGGQYCLERWGEVPLNIATFAIGIATLWVLIALWRWAIRAGQRLLPKDRPTQV